MTDYPEIGTVLYSTLEHRYREDSKSTLWRTEYIIIYGAVQKVLKRSNLNKNICIGIERDREQDVFPYPLWVSRADIGKSVFYTEKEAAKEAKRRTEREENTSLYWLREKQPMRRPWSYLLDEEERMQAYEFNQEQG